MVNGLELSRERIVHSAGDTDSPTSPFIPALQHDNGDEGRWRQPVPAL
jgi:hypothetical protein